MATVLMENAEYGPEGETAKACVQEADVATWEAAGWQPVKSKEAKK
jgi:hypothetical protein